MNRPTLISRRLATSRHQGDPDRVHAGSPQRFANHVCACTQTIDQIVKERPPGSIPPADAIGRSHSL